uniref:Uncharacterized protein n=1 Tax=Panagrolaimus sp. JU765 TaxID=591449 RepID=A0AC34Q7S1_9BILA
MNFEIIFLIFVQFFIGIIFGDNYKKEIKCFCDKLTCPSSLVCSGEFCLIGIKTDDNPGRLDQMCGWEDDERPPKNCAENWGKWTEVCACTEHLCNTFAFLRSNIDKKNQEYLEETQGRMKVEGEINGNSLGPWYNSNQIILLLIIPLGVGGFVVCLIFLNFHCKMS